MPTITIVVLVYNAGPYLAPCLDSVAAQTCPAFEAILVDNGSTDGSAAVCDAFAAQDSRFRVLHGPNLGSTGGRAKGLAEARGEYVCFVDGDDLLHPRFAELLLAACLDAGLPAACCKVRPFEGEPPPPARACGRALSLAAPAHLDALLHDKRVEYSLCNKLYHRALFEGVAFSCPAAHNEDLYLNWLLLQSAPGIALVELDGYFYRQHPASVTHRPLEEAALADQRRVAAFIRDAAWGGPLESSAWAFYYEKLLYLDSMILRQADAHRFQAHHRALARELRAGLWAALRAGRLPPAMKLTALLACGCGPLYALLCRALLTDRR